MDNGHLCLRSPSRCSQRELRTFQGALIHLRTRSTTSITWLRSISLPAKVATRVPLVIVRLGMPGRFFPGPAATIALGCGVHPKVERLGHFSVQLTPDRYSHVVEGS